MKLCYRGVCYDYTPPEVAATEQAEPIAQYNGVDVRFRNPKKALVLQPTLDLKYRGVAYRNTDAAVEGASTPTVTPSVEEKARRLTMNSTRKVLHRQQSMFNRLAAEVGLG
ncbi:MAG TPA: DUF4278 domain-containing protein [Oscillatoriales cyanobacterium M59_W2019_021]|nr:MAG: DUF4278 domain-containing protein [Cyanobacteria bacterium J055]HIK31314.1 DUF4278 domain-containing protein [Oscillatoriales cyanobacterium M4454_W2019_049]HIK52520.1 DUF4278 domain-containing protein [Oscillatoriales cyanobacterium M59_W2019_021]